MESAHAADVIFTDSLEGIAAEGLRGFFVGWPQPPAPEARLRILRAADRVLLALEPNERCVIGFITAICDGVFAAYIPLLEVLPAYQGRGIGTRLVRGMVERLADHYMIDAICDPDVAPFYERCGLRVVTGVACRNYERLRAL